MASRIDQQLAFLTEADKLKSINRANVLLDGSRPENSAEHCWHLALWALVLADAIPSDGDLDRVIVMAIVHDLVEIDAGDHPIHLPQDHDAIARAEASAADRLFAILPPDQGQLLRCAWEEFEAGTTPNAQFAKQLDMLQPLFQALNNAAMTDDDHAIILRILTEGRASALRDSWPVVYDYALARLSGGDAALPPDLTKRLAFLLEADRLKSVLRSTSLNDGSRRENSGEHSWHIALYALVMSEYAHRSISISRVIRMLLIHDLVEIDAGDVPIHSAAARDVAELEAVEQAAADRIFGLLPPALGRSLRALWEEFEAACTDDAIFAKSIDRVQPVVSNLESGGASWIDYEVTRAQVQQRVGDKVNRGAPAIWSALAPTIDAWFAAR